MLEAQCRRARGRIFELEPLASGPRSGEWRSASWLLLPGGRSPCRPRSSPRLREECHLLNAHDSVHLPRASGSGPHASEAMCLIPIQAQNWREPGQCRLWEPAALPSSEMKLSSPQAPAPRSWELTCSSHKAGPEPPSSLTHCQEHVPPYNSLLI